ncbi:hypothetical protein [Rhodococcus sp. USK10]|nr:hypothetical protein [Rhodococcus sp. USK10]
MSAWIGGQWSVENEPRWLVMAMVRLAAIGLHRRVGWSDIARD